MNHRSSSRKSGCNEQSTRTTTRSSQSNRVERKRTTCGSRVKEQIQEECCIDNESQRIERQEPRYDPKELRDAVRILSPFVRLMDDVNNPYARIVAREICKTFYRLFHPNMHPKDVMKKINWKSKMQRTKQLWNELRLYVPGGKIKKWVSLREYEDFINFNDNCDLNQARVEIKDSCPSNHSPINSCPDSVDNCSKPSECSIPVNSRCNTSNNVNLCSRNTVPSTSCKHQSAGHDSIPSAHELKSIFRKHISPAAVQINTEDQNKYAFELSTKQICERISNSKRQLEEIVNSAIRKHPVNNNIPNIEENDEISNNCTLVHDFLNRQSAGNDTILPYCEPSCSTDSPRDYRDHPSQYEYYRQTANTPRQSPRTPQRKQNNFKPLSKTPAELELITNVMKNSGCHEQCVEDSNSAVSVSNTLNNTQIVCNANLVANAFTSLSLANNELLMKKEAFRKLTENYLKFSSNPLEVCPPTCSDSPNTRRIMQEIYKNAPKLKNKFDDDEWNDNCFKDRDFVRLLPFYESVHNQLEYISKTQREYGVNMLDDIMSTFYHIHYDLGDPRLKNDMLLEHVRLITQNTWELYFYKGNKKIPAIPEPPQLQCPSSPNVMPQQCTRPLSCEQPVAEPRVPEPKTDLPRVHHNRRRSTNCHSIQEVPKQAKDCSPHSN